MRAELRITPRQAQAVVQMTQRREMGALVSQSLMRALEARGLAFTVKNYKGAAVAHATARALTLAGSIFLAGLLAARELDFE
jgi:hypothetical protein